jgi:hypothetical protein
MVVAAMGMGKNIVKKVTTQFKSIENEENRKGQKQLERQLWASNGCATCGGTRTGLLVAALPVR